MKHWRGQQLLSEINHKLAVSEQDDGKSSPIVEGSTFHFENNFYQTLPHLAQMTEVLTVNMLDGSERSFPVAQVCELISQHNDHNNDNNIDL